jgi:leucyl aminopeptidase
MQLTARSGSALAAKTDLLVLVLGKKDKAEFPRGFSATAAAAKRAGDEPTCFGDALTLYPDGRAAQKRLLLLGVGADADAEALRRAVAKAQQAAHAVEAREFVVAFGKDALAGVDAYRAGVAVGEGAVLGAYEYSKPGAKKATAVAGKAAVMAWTGKLVARFTKGVKQGVLRGNAACFARDLGNRSGNLLTPTKLAAEARKLAGPRLKCRVLSEAAMAKLKMGSLLSVSRGSREQAKLILLDYNPVRARKTICVVGKGLTFDAGGISLKPGAAMDEMRYDMCGGAAVLGLFHAISKGAIRPKARVVGLVPSSENLPDGLATKPGDIVTACDGTTIEVLNTDAEGRLILCDALAYAVKTYKPVEMVDLATLTGAVVMALGHETSGAMGNNDALRDEIVAAGEVAGDRCWPLPLWEVHRDQMKSKFADLRNINNRGDGAGSSAGGAFLSYFVGETPWVHLDIAGSAWNAKAKDYYRSGATGSGVRVLIEWLSTR